MTDMPGCLAAKTREPGQFLEYTTGSFPHRRQEHNRALACSQGFGLHALLAGLATIAGPAPDRGNPETSGQLQTKPAQLGDLEDVTNRAKDPR